MRKSITGLVTAVAMASAMLVMLPTPARAATNWFVRIGGNAANNCTSAATACPTITAVMNKGALVVNGDTIDVGPGTFVERPSINKGLTITGTGPGTTAIDGSSGGPTMVVNAPAGQVISLNGLTLARGATTFGAGLQILAGQITINNVTVTSSTAAAGAVAVFGNIVPSSNVTGTNLNITGNAGTAGSLGAGLYVGGGLVNLTGGSIANNSSPSGNSQGAGVYMSKFTAADTPTLTTNNTAINSNTLPVASPTAGGGVALAAGTNFTMNGGSLSSNTALNGGGMYVAEDAIANLNGVTLSDNTANGAAFANGGNGGAIYNSGALTVTNNSLFARNRALASSGITGNGGSIVLLTGSPATKTPTANISNSTFTGGLAAGVANATTGGAIASFTPSQLTMTNSTLNANRAAGTAGALYASSSAAVGSVSGTTFNANSSGFWGGAIVVGSTSGTDLPVFNGTNNTLTGNTAIAGGAVAVFARGTYNSTGGSMTANTSNLGGGIYVAGKAAGAVPGAASINGGSISNNVSDGAAAATTGNGGGIFSSGALTITNNALLSGNRVINSSAAGSITGYGGGVFVGPSATGDAPTASISNSTIAGGTPPVGTKNAFLGGGLAATGDIFPKTGGNAGANTPAVVTLNNATISGNSSSFAGGVVVTPNATLNSTDGVIDANTAITAAGMWVYNLATATLLRTNITNNVATGTTPNTGDAGGALNWGTLSITNATLSGNKALIGTATGVTGYGGGLYLGGANFTTKTTLNGVTLSNNVAGNYGSAIITLGTGTPATDTTSITNSTISGNQTTTGFGAITPFNPISIINSTINNNTSPAGGSGGLYNFASTATSVSGSILFGNSVSNCTTAPTDGGYNLTAAGDASCGFSAVKNDVFANPLLGPLANNGGPTLTHLPGNASPAINRIPPSTATGVNNAVTGAAIVLCGPGSLDQRGSTRPSGDLCDIGSVEVTSNAPTITGPASDTVTVGTPVSYSFTTSGVPTPTITMSGGLPSGVSFSSTPGSGTATISGTPTAPGTFPVTLTASNGASPPATHTFTLTVTEGPTLSGPDFDTYTVGSPGGPNVFTATGSPTATVSTTSPLPAGVTFVDDGNGHGTLSGTPAPGTGGEYPLVISASNGVGSPATKNFQLTVNEAPSIIGAASLTYTVGTPIPAEPYGTGGYPDPDLSATGVPAGLTFTDNGDGTASLTGTPAAGSGGPHTMTITADNGVGSDATLDVIITINEAPSISGPSSARWDIDGGLSSVNFTTTGYPDRTLTLEGALPSGVGFVDNGDNTGTIGGTPEVGTEGDYVVTITADNGVNPPATHTFTLTVVVPVIVTTGDLPDAAVGTPYSVQLTAVGGTPPYTWDVAAGPLPAGLTLSPAGVLGGTPTGPTGTYSFTVRATDSLTPAFAGVGTKVLTLTIGRGSTQMYVAPAILKLAGLKIKALTVSATLLGPTREPLVGQPISFYAGRTRLCIAFTNSAGKASCDITVPNEINAVINLGYTAWFFGSPSYEPANGASGLIR